MNEFRSTRTGKTITLPADSPHQWIQTKSKVLFVRKCYDEIWAIYLQYVVNSEDGVDGIVVSGAPGVGKSCFLDFALHKFREQGKSVLYVWGKGGKGVVFARDGSVETHSVADAIHNELAENVDFVLIDPPEGGDPNFFGDVKGKKFILAVSPDRNDCQGLRKDYGTLELFMGTTSTVESEKNEGGVPCECASRCAYETIPRVWWYPAVSL